jgi:hypothetical protein
MSSRTSGLLLFFSGEAGDAGFTCGIAGLALRR